MKKRSINLLISMMRSQLVFMRGMYCSKGSKVDLETLENQVLYLCSIFEVLEEELKK